MTEQEKPEAQKVRLMIRVHVREVSPFDVPQIQELIRTVLEPWTGAEIETAMMNPLPNRDRG